MASITAPSAEPTFNYRVEPSWPLEAPDWSPERERQADAQELRTCLEEWLCRAGFWLPRSEHKVLTAIVTDLMPRMGDKLGPELEFDLGIREAGKLIGADERTAMRALDDLKADGLLELVDEADRRARKARRWRIGRGLLVDALGGSDPLDYLWSGVPGNLASLQHTTTLCMPKGNFCEGSATSSEDEDEINERERVVKDPSAVVRCTNAKLAANALTHGQARLGGIGESGRKILVALAYGPLAPGELVELLGCQGSTVSRNLARLKALGLIRRTHRRVELIPTAVERLGEEDGAFSRRDELVGDHREDRDDYATVLERQGQGEEDDRHAREHMARRREALKRGKLKVASAFDPPPSQPEAKPVAVPVLAPAPAPVAARVEQPEREEFKRRLDQLAARNGVRPTEESAIERRRRRMGPPRKTCQHGESWERPDGRCNVCAELRRLEAAA